MSALFFFFLNFLVLLTLHTKEGKNSIAINNMEDKRRDFATRYRNKHGKFTRRKPKATTDTNNNAVSASIELGDLDISTEVEVRTGEVEHVELEWSEVETQTEVTETEEHVEYANPVVTAEDHAYAHLGSSKSPLLPNILTGRRIVEMGVLLDHLQRGCASCKLPLNIIDCTKERRYGLASLLYIKCNQCGDVTIVPTGKRHSIGDNGQGPFDVNTKLGMGKCFDL